MVHWDHEPGGAVAAGRRPAVEPGILPGGIGGLSGAEGSQIDLFFVRRDAARQARRLALQARAPGSDHPITDSIGRFGLSPCAANHSGLNSLD